MNLNNYNIPTVAQIKNSLAGKKPAFTCVSLFAGGGGSSTGYRMAGGNVLAVNEFVEAARETYRANWPDTKILPQDIRSLSGKDILSAAGLSSGELDILDGSPPCSAFSTSGKGCKGWGNKIKKYSDVTQANVEDLFFEYIRMLRDIRPKVFIAENVSGLTEGKAKGYFNLIMRWLRDSGYHVECRILNAKFLGIPQSRMRTIFIGVRKDKMKVEFENDLHPKPENKIVTLGEAFRGLALTDKDKVETNIKKYANYKLLRTLTAGSTHKKRFNLSKESPCGVSSCITATTGVLGAANPSHWENRAFSVAEIKRIMSVPDDYILTGNYSTQVERLGRMVCPLMMKAVADKVCNLGIFK